MLRSLLFFKGNAAYNRTSAARESFFRRHIRANVKINYEYEH